MIVIEKDDFSYPKLLKDIKKAPNVLYAEGNIDILNERAITVVGSRNMSEYGKEITQKLVKDLTNAGLCIVSGMAVGIDTVAHRTCLENNGKTIAVLGGALDRVFPPENKGLFKEIINKSGCVLSEYPSGVLAQKKFFVERNRIVSGLSLATLVIEASYRSGTSITANCALREGRKLFCIPHSIGSKNSVGINNWLKKGAKLVTDADEILKELDIKNTNKKQEENYNQIALKIKNIEEKELIGQDERVKKVYYYIKENKVVNVEILSNELNIEMSLLNAYLTILEMKDLIVNVRGLYYKVSDQIYV